LTEKDMKPLMDEGFSSPTGWLLTPEEVIESYGLRRSMESRFNQLQLAGGMKEAWQPTRPTLHRWVQITMIGYG